MKNTILKTKANTTFSGVKPPKVHGYDKKFDPNLNPEKQSKPQVVPQGQSPQVTNQTVT